MEGGFRWIFSWLGRSVEVNTTVAASLLPVSSLVYTSRAWPQPRLGMSPGGSGGEEDLVMAWCFLC